MLIDHLTNGDDGLAAFSAEPDAAVSVDDILSRGTLVHWDEAVAVVEELCGILQAAPNEPLVPRPHDVLINPADLVTVRSGSRGDRSITGLVRMLHALLSTSNVPVALRLFVTRASSPETFASIQEFASALAYFSKPSRAELIRALYERHATAAVPPPISQIDATPIEESMTQTHSPQRRRPTAWTVPALILAVAAAAFVLTVGAWLWFTLVPARSANGSLSNAIGQTRGALQRLSAEVGGFTRSAAPSSSTVATPPLKPEAASLPRVAARPSRQRSVAVAPQRVQLVPPALEPAVPAAFLASAPGEGPSIVRDEESVEPPPVYSSRDAEVRPPVILHPHLPTPSEANSRSPELNTMELVVSENGTVEQVRLVDGPRRMPDMMLLSGAKTWKFRPAMKDGEPVRYRTVVTWIGFP